jgi:hypothetical protein
MIEGRVAGQAKEHFLYDRLGEVVEFASHLPQDWIKQTDLLLSRALGMPSEVDFMVASFLQRTVGAFEELVGKPGLWNERRVVELAQTINNLTYMGALGFKPFGVMRNMFQPLITAPAELGGVKDLGHLVAGAKRALDPKFRRWVRDIGAITEYAPEIHARAAAFPFGKWKVAGKYLPSSERLRDVSLWGFRGSDRWTRYTAAGATIEKWERALRKVGNVSSRTNADEFIKRVKLKMRDPWVKHEIENLIRRGKLEDAKTAFVKDVVADTQFLYGKMDSPDVTQAFGGLGRTATIFQTWWMNWANALEKWARRGLTGDPEPIVTMVLSNAIAYHLMDTIWSKRTSALTVGLGPIPTDFNEFLLPPAWKMPYHFLNALMDLPTDGLDSRHAKAFLDSSAIFVPGGLFAKDMLRGTREEGFEGFAKGLIRYRED